MSALDEYRKYNEYLAAHPTAELEARRYIDLADAAIDELEAEREDAKADAKCAWEKVQGLETCMFIAARASGEEWEPGYALQHIIDLKTALDRAEQAEAALETANEHEHQLIEVVAERDRRVLDARNRAARRIRKARNKANAALDRAEQAEAENERLRGLLAVCDACHEPVRVQLSSSVRERAHRANVAALERCWHEAEADARAARAENERLRVCGTCRHWSDSLYECKTDTGDERGRRWDCRQSDPCHFTPSRWTPYWETGK